LRQRIWLVFSIIYLDIVHIIKKTVGMFIRHLTGEDEISWKYVRLIRKMLELHYTSIDINVYREATRIIYPYRPVRLVHLNIDINSYFL
jgi:hypothetical protein